jgi:hypothetical protein
MLALICDHHGHDVCPCDDTGMLMLAAGHYAGSGQRVRDSAPAAPYLIGCYYLHLSSAWYVCFYVPLAESNDPYQGTASRDASRPNPTGCMLSCSNSGIEPVAVCSRQQSDWRPAITACWSHIAWVLLHTHRAGWVAETGGMVGAGTVSLQEVVSEPLDVVAAYDQVRRYLPRCM